MLAATEADRQAADEVIKLIQAVEEGHRSSAVFVIQMEDVLYLHPNDDTDPAFGKALREAAAAGVQVLAMDCAVTENSMKLRQPVKVELSRS